MMERGAEQLEQDKADQVAEVVQLSGARPRAKRTGPRKRTFSVKRTSKTELRRLAVLYPVDESVQRPRTRGECENAPRPCPFLSCKYHLAVDVTSNGSLTLNFPESELEDLVDTCALDAAARGGMTLDDVGARMNLTRERVRQIETIATLALPDEAIRKLQEFRTP